jgi:hypothetical protein
MSGHPCQRIVITASRPGQDALDMATPKFKQGQKSQKKHFPDLPIS